MRSVILAVACVLVTPPTAPSTAPSAPSAPADRFTARVDDLAPIVAPLFAERSLPGMAFAVVEPDRLVGLGVLGVRVRGEDARVERGDRFHLGSCTKAVTATLVAVLVADGTLRFESTVGEVLGPSVPEMDTSWKDVTIEALLQHRGGAPANPDRSDWRTAFACNDDPEVCRSAFVRSMLSRPTETTKGQFVYSNQGYALAGRMCEVAAKQPYERLVVERVLTPLGVTTAGFGPPSQSTGGAAPRGHAADGTLQDEDNPAAIAPAGRLHLSLADWARFVALHLRRDGQPGVPLTRELFDRMHTPTAEAMPYAAGWRVVGTGPMRMLTHAGSNTLWFCVAVVAPDRGFAVLVATNQGGDDAERACNAVAEALARWEDERRSKAVAPQQ